MRSHPASCDIVRRSSDHSATKQQHSATERSAPEAACSQATSKRSAGLTVPGLHNNTVGDPARPMHVLLSTATSAINALLWLLCMATPPQSGDSGSFLHSQLLTCHPWVLPFSPVPSCPSAQWYSPSPRLSLTISLCQKMARSKRNPRKNVQMLPASTQARVGCQ